MNPTEKIKEIHNEKQKSYDEGIENGSKQREKEIKEEIEKIDTQIPDDDGIPVDISAEEFKQKLLKVIGEEK